MGGGMRVGGYAGGVTMKKENKKEENVKEKE
jgi:hypothetical protein